ncbi:hypothetical protein ACH79_20275 [Bradyrhizobium sp. CCBAU 051011]|uniref:hypothetical protein n=1 Tax=Bradyrhizobium sp. CCBAU 051011 TaxID=858422 RepID=UPI001373D401|nr:hypothetical protein ACH79_20275 [Bradyrhizobium sp. CCBAU 051011]
MTLASQGAMNTSQIAKSVGLERMAVARIRRDPVKASSNFSLGACNVLRVRAGQQGHDTHALQAYLGHKDVQHTVRYTQLSPTRFKDFWRG